MVTTTFQLTREEKILDQIQKSASLSEAESELDKEAGFKDFFGKKLGNFISRKGGGIKWANKIKNAANFNPNSFKGSMADSIRSRVAGRNAISEGTLVKDFFGPDSQKRLNSAMTELGSHGQNKRIYDPRTWGSFGLGDDAKHLKSYIKETKNMKGLGHTQKGMYAHTNKYAPTSEAAKFQNKGLDRELGWKSKKYDKTNVTNQADDLTQNTKPKPDPKQKPKPDPTQKPTPPPPGNQASIGNSWKDWREKGWSGLTEQQRRTLTIYGAGGFMLKDPAFNMLGVNNNRN